ncbi:unnamed protein product [Cylicocyclus nassatus]|uniref:Uncharacterized protein n=1 Tax=Cylicocyclus nassatus TaxID=53992 RepID=A0AA36H143_CYLNA|nr:unnamed protein product [Cylicocyclus nassatus]
MHPAKLFLLSFLAGVLATPVHHAIRRHRRDESTKVNTTTTEAKEDGPDLPPLPLDYDEEEDIYMSLDDPRVGTVDEEGNVLVPVDDDGNVLPGFEHLVRPLQVKVQEDAVPETDVLEKAASLAKVIVPALKIEHQQAEQEQQSKDVDDSNDDESGTEPEISKLPLLNDYVDSREKTENRRRIGFGVKPESPSGAVVMKNVTVIEKINPDMDENAINVNEEPISEAEENAIDEIFGLNKDEDLEKEMEKMDDYEKVGVEKSKKLFLGESVSSEEIEGSDRNDEESPLKPVRPQIGGGVKDEEDARVLPKDEEESRKLFDDLRKADLLGLDVGSNPNNSVTKVLSMAALLLIGFVLPL